MTDAAARTHVPTDDPTWQESNECHAFDPAAGIGFITASGVFVNDGTGLAYAAAVVPGPGDTQVCFQRTNNDVALVEGDRGPMRNGVSFLHWDWLDETTSRLTVDDPDCEIDVVFSDFHEEAHWAQASVPGADGHVETSGSIEGSIRVGDHTHEISCLAHRDQSWGSRDNRPVRSHAWLAGTCGLELSFTSENLVVERGGHVMSVRGGYVHHDGSVDHVADPDLRYEFEWDLFSPTAVRGVLRTESGHEFPIETGRCSPTFFNGRTWRGEEGTLAAVDRLFEVRVGDRAGIANLNLLANVTAGRQAPALMAHNPIVAGVWTAQ
ncbi:MAG: hypothetical protein AAF548_10315 [Actinomycetota bacterium]